MSRSSSQRAARIAVRLYPPIWRARYGDEFEQLLLDQRADGGWPAHWWLNVAGHATRARLDESGLTGAVAPAEDAISRATRWLGVMMAVSLLGGLAMWSQLAVGWQWAAPASNGTRAAVELMSAGLGGLIVIATMLLSARLFATVRLVRTGAAVRVVPLALAALCAVLLVIGAARIGLTWPGTGGHHWAQRGLVPAWLARRTWALTLWISSFWAHPRQLLSLGSLQIGWMLLTPLLMIVLARSLRRIVTGTAAGPPPRRLAVAAASAGPACMLLVVLGAARWVAATTPEAHGLYASGAIDLGLLVLSATAAAAAMHLARRIRLAGATAHTG